MTSVRRYGQDALLVELDDPYAVPGMLDAAARLDGVDEVVPGARTLLVRLVPCAARSPLVAALTALVPTPQDSAAREPLDLEVSYDGADLDEVAELAGLDRSEVVDRHSGATYTVRFCGFSPGFAYLDGLDERLRLPRRDEPRTAVPAGSVAIADEFTGVYPHPSPGGWRLLGTTTASLWDVTRASPALLTPGATVRFVAT